MSTDMPDNKNETAETAQRLLFRTPRNGDTSRQGREQDSPGKTLETISPERSIGDGNYTSLPSRHDELLNRPQWKTSPNLAEKAAVTTVATQQSKPQVSALNSEAVVPTGHLQCSNSEAVASLRSDACSATSWPRQFGGKALVFKDGRPSIPIFDMFENNPVRSWNHFKLNRSWKDVERNDGSPFPAVRQEDSGNKGLLGQVGDESLQDGNSSMKVSSSHVSTENPGAVPEPTKPQNRLAATGCLTQGDVERFHQGQPQSAGGSVDIIETKNVQVYETFTRFVPTSGDRVQWTRMWDYGRTTVIDHYGHRATRRTIESIDEPNCPQCQSFDVGTKDQLTNRAAVLIEEVEEPEELPLVDASKQLAPEVMVVPTMASQASSREDQAILCSGPEPGNFAEVGIYDDNSAPFDLNLEPCSTEDIMAFLREHPMVDNKWSDYTDLEALQMEYEIIEDLASVEATLERKQPESSGASPLADSSKGVASIQELTSPSATSPREQSPIEDQVTPDGSGQDPSVARGYEHMTATSCSSPNSASTGDSVVPCGQGTPQQGADNDTSDEHDSNQQGSESSDEEDSDEESAGDDICAEDECAMPEVNDDVYGEHVCIVPEVNGSVGQSTTPPWVLEEPAEEDCFDSTEDESEITLGTSDTEDLDSYTLSSASSTVSGYEYDSYDETTSLGFSCEAETTHQETNVVQADVSQSFETKEPACCDSCSNVTAETVSTTSNSGVEVSHSGEAARPDSLEQLGNEEPDDEELFDTKDSGSEHLTEDEGCRVPTSATALPSPTGRCQDEIPMGLRTMMRSSGEVSITDETGFHVDEKSTSQRRLVDYSQGTPEDDLAGPHKSPDPTDFYDAQSTEKTEDRPPQGAQDQDYEHGQASIETYTKVMEVYFSQQTRQFMVVPANSDCVVPDLVPNCSKVKQAAVRVPDSAESCKADAPKKRHPGSYEADTDTSEASFYSEKKDDPGPKRKVARLGLTRSHRGRRLHPDWSGAPLN